MHTNKSSLLALVLAYPGCVAQHAEQRPAAPNIVFVLADDLGNHDTGFTNAKFYETRGGYETLAIPILA